MAVGSGRYRHPAGASLKMVELIDALLVVDPAKRPDIQAVCHYERQSLTNLGD